MATKSTKRTTTRTSKAKVAEAVEAVAEQSTQDQFATFLTELRDLTNRHLSALTGDVPFTPDNGGELDEPAVADENGEAEEQSREDRAAELKTMTSRQLQNVLIAMTDEDGDALFEADEIKAEKDKFTLVDNILAVEFGDEEEEDEEEEDEADEDDDADDEEEEGYSEEDLMKLSPAELRKLATTEFEVDASEVKGKDKATIVELILAAQDGDEDDEYETDEDDEEGDEEDEEWTEEELNELPIKEVREVADEAGIKYTAAQGKSKAKLIELILAA